MITKEQALALEGHTPEPWASHQDDEGSWAVIDSANGFVTFAFPAECGLGGDTEANARLIAAAPDLRETVIALHERVERLMDLIMEPVACHTDTDWLTRRFAILKEIIHD